MNKGIPIALAVVALVLILVYVLSSGGPDLGISEGHPLGEEQVLVDYLTKEFKLSKISTLVKNDKKTGEKRHVSTFRDKKRRDYVQLWVNDSGAVKRITGMHITRNQSDGGLAILPVKLFFSQYWEAFEEEIPNFAPFQGFNYQFQKNGAKASWTRKSIDDRVYMYWIDIQAQ